jgi:A/G-specific adenine glycosylase
VQPYYRRFLERWPTPATLAAASRDELLGEWSGLGYYRRAHLLMDAACAVSEGGGELPRDAAGLAALPGIGEYTAAAVASIAHDEPVAAIDGNVERVLTRLLALPGNPRQGDTAKAVRRAADELLDRDAPGAFNQALMDLGATLCRPRAPRCEACPWSQGCLGLAEGRPERYPQLPARAPATQVTRLAVVVRQRGDVLLERRRKPPNEGFYELPALDVDAHADGATPLFDRSAVGPGPRLVNHLRQRFGLTVFLERKLPEHRHSITRYRIRVHPFRATLSAGRVSDPLAWISPKLSGAPITTASRRILADAHPDLFGRALGEELAPGAGPSAEPTPAPGSPP